MKSDEIGRWILDWENSEMATATRGKSILAEKTCAEQEHVNYTEAKVDVAQEIEQRAKQAAQAGADHCALYSIFCVQSSLSTG